MKIKSYPGLAQSFGIVGITILSMLIFMPLNLFLNEYLLESASFLIYYTVTMTVPFIIAHQLKLKSDKSIDYQIIPQSGFLVLILIIVTIALQWGITGPIANSIPMPDSFKSLFKELSEKMNDGYGLIAVVIMAPLFEELIFRGIILDGLLKRTTVLKAILWSSFLFGIVHLNPWQFIGAMLIGIFSGWIYYRTKNLGYSIIIHFANNFTASILMFLFGDLDMMDMELHEMYGGLTQMYIIIPASIVIFSLGILYLSRILPKGKVFAIEQSQQFKSQKFSETNSIE